MTDTEKINKLYTDIKNIHIPDYILDSELQEMVNDIGEGLKIILDAIKLIGVKYKSK